MRGLPFMRLMAAAAALMSASAAMPNPMTRAQAVTELGGLRSRGKGGKHAVRAGRDGSTKVKRAALKRRNVARNRRAHRG